MNKELVIADVLNSHPLSPQDIDKRVMSNSCGCYAIFCEKTQMYYVGSSINCRARKGAHFAGMRNGKHSNSGIRNDCKKYGIEYFHFFMLEHCQESELVETEKKWYKVIGRERLYNYEREANRAEKYDSGKKKYGKETKKYALLLLKQGYSYKEVSEKTGIKEQYLRTLVFRDVSNENTDVSHVSETVKHENIEQETSVSDVSETEKKQETSSSKFHPAYLLYFTSVGLACSAIAKTLQGVGLPLALVVGGTALISLYGVAAARGAWLWLNVGMMLFCEAICALVHIHWSNAALWKQVNALPLDIWPNKYRNDLGEVVMLYGGADTDKPFLIACGIAVVLFVCSLFAGLTAYSNRAAQSKN